MFKKSLILFMLLLLLVSSVNAFEAYIYPTEEDSNKIYFDEVAHYEMKLVNDDEKDIVFRVSINPVEWMILTPNSIPVPAGDTKIVELDVKPKTSVYQGPGTHYVPIYIRTSDGQSKDTQIVLFIKSFKENYGEYLPAISLGANIRDEINPTKNINVELVLRNRNILNIENMTLDIHSELFSTQDIVNLSGLAENRLQYKFDVDSTVKPGEYDLEVRAVYEGKVLSEVQNVFEILTVSQIDRNLTESDYWLKKVKISTITNSGNLPKEVTTSLDTPWYIKLFSSVDVEANHYEKENKKWIINLEPGESARFVVKENFRFLFYFGVAIVIFVVLYFFLRSPVVLEKQIIVTGQDAEGISEMKVRIFVRNRTGKAFYNLRLIDKSPSIATVLKNHSLGVLQPNKIIPTDRKGTIVKWDIESLEAYEERIFTYNLKARLKIIGNLSLPAVKAKFENVKGKERTVISNKAVIGERV